MKQRYREQMHIPLSANACQLVACLIAQELRGGAPSVEWLRARFGMSRATAYRWRKAWVEAGAMLAAREGRQA